jgi:flagellar biosynthesis/type III secretory pathway protein FliH
MDSELKQYLEAMESRLTEKIRTMKMDLLRSFTSFSEAESLRLRKVEADQSNLDASISGRMAVLEKRLFEIEMRLGGAGRN